MTLTSPLIATRSATVGGTGSRGVEARLAVVLLAVAALAVVALLLALVWQGATETTLTPTPTPQTAPLAP